MPIFPYLFRYFLCSDFFTAVRFFKLIFFEYAQKRLAFLRKKRYNTSTSPRGHINTYTILLYTISRKKARKRGRKKKIFPNFHISP